MRDQNGHINHGWRIPARRKIEAATKISDGREYPKGQILRKCQYCPKFVPFGASFHFEECPGQAA